MKNPYKRPAELSYPSSEAADDRNSQETAIMMKANCAVKYNLLDGNRWLGHPLPSSYWSHWMYSE